MAVFIAFSILVSVSIIYSLIKGGPSERAAAVVTFIGVVVSPAVAHRGPELWQGSEVGILVVDLLALIAYATIMLLSGRFWPIWTTAFQLLTVAAHLGPLFRNAGIAFPFAISEEIWSWIILLQLLLVTWLGSRRRRRSSRPMPVG